MIPRPIQLQENSISTEYVDRKSIDLSIILISWNSLELTSAAIRSIQQHTAGVQYEVIVVDNGSTLDGGALELGRRFPDARIIANADNRGFAAANNQGFAVTTGRQILLLNSDTLQTENAIGGAVGYMDAHEDVGILGVMHRNGDAEQTYQPSAASFPTPWGGVRVILRGLFVRGRHPLPQLPLTECNVDWVTGSFLLLRRECLERVGYLDERFFVYGEDIDLCFQVQKAGWKVRFWPDVSLIHFGSSSLPQIADKTFMLYRNQLEFFRKNCSSVSVLAFYIAMTARLGLSLLFQAMRYFTGQEEWKVVQSRWQRLWNFFTLQSDRRGLSRV